MLKPVLTDPAILKIGQNMKYDWLMFAQRGIAMTPVDDTMLMSYVLDAGKDGHGMDELSVKWLGHAPIPYKDVAGSGRALGHLRPGGDRQGRRNMPPRMPT